ncbi:MAG: NAD-dependent epimerase/dehydratase family protein [Nitrososphaerales archaeon]|jgi:nucleoside-diphosphate-sugar epimerase
MVQEAATSAMTKKMSSQEVLNHYRKKTILITGGAGCIGTNLARALIKAGPERVVILDDLSAAYEWNIPKDSKVTFLKGSILDEEMMKRAFGYKPEYVFHLAAHFANQNSVDHPETDLLVNGLGTLRALEYSRLADVERFVFASSGCSVYGSNAPLPLREDFVSIHLDTPYQMNKLVGELYCNYFFDYYKLPVATARYFNVYGPGEVPGKYRNVIPNFIWAAMHGKALPVMGTGKDTRDFTFVGDIVDGTLRLGVIEGALGGAFNLASETETSVIDLAKMVNDVTHNKTGTTYTSKRDWDKSSRRRASIEKAKRVLGYDPQTQFADGLRTTYEWIRSNSKLISNALDE